jgi:hypothetical protein
MVDEHPVRIRKSQSSLTISEFNRRRSNSTNHHKAACACARRRGRIRKSQSSLTISEFNTRRSKLTNHHKAACGRQLRQTTKHPVLMVDAVEFGNHKAASRFPNLILDDPIRQSTTKAACTRQLRQTTKHPVMMVDAVEFGNHKAASGFPNLMVDEHPVRIRKSQSSLTISEFNTRRSNSTNHHNASGADGRRRQTT